MLYKSLQLLLQPELWILLCLLGAWWLSRSPHLLKLARGLLLIGILLFWLLGTRPLNDILAHFLESQYPPLDADSITHQDLTVVLSGGVQWDSETQSPILIGSESLDRVICGITLLHDDLTSRLLIAGGVGDAFEQHPPDAEVLRDWAIRLGAPPSLIHVESRSRNTAEAADEVRQMLPDTKRVILVTSALHLPRAAGVFRKKGFEVLPAPCPGQRANRQWRPDDFVPQGGRLSSLGLIIHEYVGFAAYYLAGRL